MKQCPACDFSFPDFHQVCDFDGTELVPIPEKPSIIAPRPSRLRQLAKSPLWLIALSGLALFSSAILFGFYDAIYQSAPVVNNHSDERTGNGVPAIVSPKAWVTANQRPRPRLKNSNRLASLKGNHPRTRAAARHYLVKGPRRTSSPPSDRAETAQVTYQRPVSNKKKETTVAVGKPQPSPSEPQLTRVTAKDSPRASNGQDSKVVAMLKTTWRVLKKPFKF